MSDAILRKAAVCAKTSLSYVTIWRLMRAGNFPHSVQISPGRVGWLESDIDAWIAQRARRPR